MANNRKSIAPQIRYLALCKVIIMGIHDDIASLADEFCSTDYGFEVEFQPGEKRYGLIKLIVPDSHQGQGYGSDLMRCFTKILDNHGHGAALVASEKYGSDLDELILFYEKFGFISSGPRETDSNGFKQQLMERV